MLEKLFSRSTPTCTTESLAQENSALRARVAELEREASAYRRERDAYFGRVTELLVHSQEVLQDHDELHALSLKPSPAEALSAECWREIPNGYLKKLATIYLRLMELSNAMWADGNSDGLKTGCACQCSTRKVRRVG